MARERLPARRRAETIEHPTKDFAIARLGDLQADTGVVGPVASSAA